MQNIISKIKKFVDERDWSQFHNSKDLALALSIEAAELNEVFLWKDSENADMGRIKEELADVLIYALLIAEKNNLNIEEIILDKLEQNKNKYPTDKVKGLNIKYSEIKC